MKKLSIFPLLIALLSIHSGCNKPNSGGTSGSSGACKPIVEATNLVGNAATIVYSYSPDGNIKNIVKHVPGGFGALLDSAAIFYDHVERYSPGRISGTYNITNTVFDANIFTNLPTKSNVSITLDGVEQRNYYSFFYFYDTKNRLIKVGYQTNTVIGDQEYDLNIAYDNNNNVASLTYVTTTGPASTLTITAAGYDNKPNPYSSLKNYPFYMNRGWTNYDPEPIFNALSKNNLMGYTYSGITRTTEFTYNSNGFPTLRRSTNTNISGTAVIDETYSYECK